MISDKKFFSKNEILIFQLSFLPFAYVMDSWRWKLFTGEIDDSNLNEAWLVFSSFISYYVSLLNKALVTLSILTHNTTIKGYYNNLTIFSHKKNATSLFLRAYLGWRQKPVKKCRHHETGLIPLFYYSQVEVERRFARSGSSCRKI